MNTFVSVLIVLTLGLGSANASTPVGKAMHEMMTALQCEENRLPAKLCIGDTIENLKNGAKSARAALFEMFKTPDKQATIAGMFDALDFQINQLGDAKKSKNQIAHKSAIEAIHAIMDAGHSFFVKRPF